MDKKSALIAIGICAASWAGFIPIYLMLRKIKKLEKIEHGSKNEKSSPGKVPTEPGSASKGSS